MKVLSGRATKAAGFRREDLQHTAGVICHKPRSCLRQYRQTVGLRLFRQSSNVVLPWLGDSNSWRRESICTAQQAEQPTASDLQHHCRSCMLLHMPEKLLSSASMIRCLSICMHAGIPEYVNIVAAEDGSPVIQLENSAGWSAQVWLSETPSHEALWKFCASRLHQHNYDCGSLCARRTANVPVQVHAMGGRITSWVMPSGDQVLSRPSGTQHPDGAMCYCIIQSWHG